MEPIDSWGEYSGSLDHSAEVQVCIEHFRFVPCRGGHHQQPSGRYTEDRPCRLSSNERMVAAVGGYQSFTGTAND